MTDRPDGTRERSDPHRGDAGRRVVHVGDGAGRGRVEVAGRHRLREVPGEEPPGRLVRRAKIRERRDHTRTRARSDTPTISQRLAHFQGERRRDRAAEQLPDVGRTLASSGASIIPWGREPIGVDSNDCARVPGSDHQVDAVWRARRRRPSVEPVGDELGRLLQLARHPVDVAHAVRPRDGGRPPHVAQGLGGRRLRGRPTA